MSTAASFSTPGRAGVSARTRSRARSDRRAVRASGVSSSEGYEEVRYGLGRGSVAYYPIDASASSTTTTTTTMPLLRADTEPTTRYIDGPLDAAAIWLFNLKLEQAVNDGADEEERRRNAKGLPAGGFDRLVALADRIASSGRTPPEQRAVVLATLLGLIPPWVRTQFKRLIDPRWAWVDKMNALITVNAFAWLVGPCEIVPRDDDGELAAVKLRKCRYLEQCGCTASCANFCKRPTEGFFREAFGVDAHLAPNHEDGSCVMTFGRKPPEFNDPAFSQRCYSSCGKAAACDPTTRGGLYPKPCHRLGDP